MKPTVVLLHGLMRTSRSMAGLGDELGQAGYEVWARSYPSQRGRVEESAALIVEALRRETRGRPLHLVTHSLGGILARFIAGPMGKAAGLDVRGVVMLAPPNAGSRLARRLSSLRLFQRVYGPAGQELAGLEASWPVPEVPVAVIAGTRPRGLNPIGWFATTTGLIGAGEASDGTVLVEETRLAGMVDFATVPASHTFIMDHPEARAMILRFLRSGRLR